MSYVRLDSDSISYVLDLSSGGIPRMAYWGSRLHDRAEPDQLAAMNNRPLFQAWLDEPYFLNIFPEQGTGFRGRPALSGEKDGQHWATLFKIEKIEQKNQSARIFLIDNLAGLKLVLDLEIDATSGILSRRTTIKNLTEPVYRLSYCAAGAIEIPSNCHELLTFHGCWTGEFLTQRYAFRPGLTQFENRTGRTSHEFFPGLIAGTKDFGENHGTVYGTHLGWSGNSVFFTELIPDGIRQIQMAELLMPGEIVLGKNDTYTSPWIYSGLSHKGLNGLSHKFHQFLRRKILPRTTQTSKRPIIFNSWEAVYFDHNLDDLCRMASKTADLGFERFVLDDGWFHNRNDDTQALGDWWTDQKKYPQGLQPLIEHVENCGMEFGLWIEPEMISPNSELYRKHPDWVLGLEGFPQLTGRQQLVLDLSRQDVMTYLFDRLNEILALHPISYLKWDMNRTLTMAGHKGCPAFHNQTKSLYDLIDRLREAHPHIEIESCASGGGRIDFEILKRTDRFWTSDSNDPFRRQQIQKGASIFFPPEITGSHIGPATCHTSGRITDITFRALTSFFSHFGAEFNLFELDDKEENILKTYISLHKQYRDIIHHGRSIRLELSDPLRNGLGVVSSDMKTALFCIVQMDIPTQTSARTICFSHLDPDSTYRLRLIRPVHHSIESKLVNPENWYSGFRLPGKTLMQTGISIFLPWPGTGVMFELKSINR